MSLVSIQYEFRQAFPFPADTAFAWCTDFRSGDPALEGIDGRRSVRWLADDTVVLTDRFYRRGARPMTKVKLVRLRGADRAWTSTHLIGPNRHSQFWYRVAPDGRAASHLEFEGLHLERRPRAMSAAQRSALSRRLAREDAEAWRLLAGAMQQDLRPERPSRS